MVDGDQDSAMPIYAQFWYELSRVDDVQVKSLGDHLVCLSYILQQVSKAISQMEVLPVPLECHRRH